MAVVLDELYIADPVEAWEALGLTVSSDGVVVVGGVRLRLGVDGEGGIVGWSLRGSPAGDLDGLPTRSSSAPVPEPVSHPLGLEAVDHVVALTDDFERSVAALRGAGLDYRRTRDAGGGFRQAFFVVGPCLLELGGPASDGPPGARFWGLTLVVSDLDAAAARLGPLLGRVKDAVQPGRRIATLRREAGLGMPVALMTPRG